VPRDEEVVALRARCVAEVPRPSPAAAPTVAETAPEAAKPPAAAETAAAPETAPVPSAPPTDAILAAADRFADGDARGTLAALAGFHGASARDEALAQLLAAAAHHALFELGGRREPAELRQALLAARNAHRLAPELRPPASVFSPRFVDWYASVR